MADAGSLTLLVEDNRVNRLLLTRQVQQLGHRVEAVENGRLALQALRQKPFDLMLLDIEMPELDGFGLLEQLLADPQLRDLPVIVTSGLEGVANVVRCIELGAEDYLQKPVNTILLKARIGASLEKKRLRDEQRELVRRFATSPVDVGVFHGLMQRANRGERLRYDEELRFMANNLRSDELERHVAAHADDYACLIYAPYLFGTTYWPASAAPERAIVVPCLHDEPAAYMAIFRELLERSAALLFNADVERSLALDGLGVTNPYSATLGFGFPDDMPAGDAERFRARVGIAGPLLLYTGRLESGKNVPLLVEWFTRYKAERPGPLALALTGRGDVVLPIRPDVIGLGTLGREELTDAYAACTVICQPSVNESFSIVIMEAWLQGRPAIVHADCAVTREHVEQSGGGYAAGSYEAFRDALDALLADPARADELGARGRAYVRDRYSWSSLLPQIEERIAAFSRPRPLAARLAQRGVARALAFTRRRFDDALLELVTRAEGDLPATLDIVRRGSLRRAAEVARPSYSVRSGLPVVGPAVAWLRRQLTAHLKEPYLDPIIAGQDRFNRDLLETLLPALDESLREQRRLRAEVDLLREQIGQRGDDGV